MMLLKMKLIFAVVTLACLDSFVLPDFQGDALFALRASLVSSDDQLTDWNPNQVNPCTWSNVLCDPNDNVISLTWSDIGFSGTLSPKVGALTALQTLTLQGNGITGGIPEELGKLTNLTTLNLEHNDLTGEIPSTLGNLKKLQFLSLGINNLNGTIPDSLSNLSSLINLQLSYNALSGQIPSRLFHVPEYDFRGNRLNCDGNSHYHCASAIADSGLKSSSNKPKLGIIVGAVGGLIILLSTGGVLYFMCKRRHNGYKREVLVGVAGISQVDSDGWSPNLSLNILVQIGKTTTDRSIGVYGENRRKILELLNFMKSDRPTAHVNGIQSDGKMGHDLSVFSYATLMAATCNFSQENKLGQGGFGPVYKGKLTTGREIAVKRLSKGSGQGILEFKNELTLISELQHTNLVQLFGFCIHGEEMMLIYEYMPNKSLDYHLFDSIKGLQLNWEKRFTIIEGIAQGLLYLHKYSRLQVIHRDLKSSNVLLDENMNPKISDFGMARIFTYNELEANTNRIVGTRGYMSPEYAMEGIFSIKSDVYSFGVLMLEIISGRRSNSFYNDDRVLNIVGYTWELWKEGAGLKLMDPTLGDDSCINRDQVLRCIHVGLLCVEENGADRPTMFDVISMLTNQTMSLPTPTKPAFCVERKVVVTGISIGGNGPGITSINGMSNSDFNAR